MFSLIFAISTALSLAPASAAIQIGAVYCKSGDQATHDDSSWKGAQLAVAEINKAGGIRGNKVDLIRMAPDSTPADVKSSVAGALKNPGFIGLVGLSRSELAFEAGYVAAKKGVPFVTSGATSPKLSPRLGQGYFLACFGDNAQAATAAEWLSASMGVKTAAILFNPRSSQERSLRSYFIRAFRSAGGRITASVPFVPGKTLLVTPSILKADAVFLAADSPVTALPVIRQLRSKGFPGPIIGGRNLDVPYAWLGNPAADGVYFTTHAFPAITRGSAPKDSWKTFTRNYKKTYRTNPDVFSALGYDATTVLLDAIGRCETPSAKMTRAALAAGVDVNGLTGHIKLDKSGHVPEKPVALVNASTPDKQTLQILPSQVPKP
ncbi:MAG: ABC transporter substrate-binding protein [bacterium]